MVHKKLLYYLCLFAPIKLLEANTLSTNAQESTPVNPASYLVVVIISILGFIGLVFYCFRNTKKIEVEFQLQRKTMHEQFKTQRHDDPPLVIQINPYLLKQIIPDKPIKNEGFFSSLKKSMTKIPGSSQKRNGKKNEFTFTNIPNNKSEHLEASIHNKIPQYNITPGKSKYSPKKGNKV